MAEIRSLNGAVFSGWRVLPFTMTSNDGTVTSPSSWAVNGMRSVYFEDVTPLMTDMLEPLEMPLFHSIPETRPGIRLIWRRLTFSAEISTYPRMPTVRLRG